jgi:hypothetical protein
MRAARILEVRNEAVAAGRFKPRKVPSIQDQIDRIYARYARW